MDIDDETSNVPVEIGSDELLSDDNLRLPESANILVRIHALRAWLTGARICTCAVLVSTFAHRYPEQQ